MKNTFYDIIHKEYIDNNFHEANVINYKFNKDNFIIRLQTTSYNHFVIDEIKDKIVINDDDNESIIFDLVLKNPKMKFNNFVSCINDSFAEIIDINPIKEKNKIVGFEIFILGGSLPDGIEYNENTYSWFRIFCSDYYYHIIGHVINLEENNSSKKINSNWKNSTVKLEASIEEEQEFISKLYKDINY